MLVLSRFLFPGLFPVSLLEFPFWSLFRQFYHFWQETPL